MTDATDRITTIGSWEAENVTFPQVESALSSLRRHDRRAALRTSVLTLVTIVDDQAQADAALEIVNELGARHPSRTIVVIAGPEADGESPGVDAAASVQSLERGSTAMCFEELVLRVRGRARHHLDSIVEPFTLPDLPAVVWLPSRLPAVGDPLLSAVDRLVVDSRAVPAAGDTLDRIATLSRRLPVTDLSWTRLSPWRAILAGLFEGNLYRPFLDDVRDVEVAGNESPRHLLGGWLLSRLRLSPDAVVLRSAEHVSIRITAASDGAVGHFVVERPGAPRAVVSCIDIDGGPTVRQTMHLREQWPALSLAQALTRIGHDSAYRDALSGAAALRSLRRPPAEQPCL